MDFSAFMINIMPNMHVAAMHENQLFAYKESLKVAPTCSRLLHHLGLLIRAVINALVPTPFGS